MSELNQLISNIKQAEAGSEKRKQWNPSHVGEIDIHISADGGWFHQGRPFKRLDLAKLFAGILQKQGDDYFLVTPGEKLRITVEDAPFVANLVEALEEDSQSAIVFTTNLGDKIVLDNQHPIRVEIDPQTQEPRPYIYFRNGLEALISRSAFYDLICLADEEQCDDIFCFTVSSLGESFELGCVNSLET
jgi:hypothetical protein